MWLMPVSIGLRPSGGRAVALAVAVGAEERAALDHLARDAELGLGGVVALPRPPAPRGSRGTQHAAGGRRRSPYQSRGPLPDVARPCREARAVGRVRPDRRGAGEPSAGSARQGKSPVPVVGQPATVRRSGSSPQVNAATVEAAARGALPLRLGGQRRPDPRRVGLGVLVGDVDDGMVGALVPAAVAAPRGAATRHRASRSTTGSGGAGRPGRGVRGEDHRPGLQVLRRAPGKSAGSSGRSATVR